MHYSPSYSEKLREPSTGAVPGSDDKACVVPEAAFGMVQIWCTRMGKQVDTLFQQLLGILSKGNTRNLDSFNF